MGYTVPLNQALFMGKKNNDFPFMRLQYETANGIKPKLEEPSKYRGSAANCFAKHKPVKKEGGLNGSI